jgi:ribosomal protein S18 acetylase RimI-like enzyme
VPDEIPQLRDVLDAQQTIRPFLDPTPVRAYPSLSDAVGCELFVKHENHQPTGAFKVRGGINLVSHTGSDQLAAGVYAASTGNHGQSVAYAANLFGVTATIFVPRGANPVKVSSMRSLGATVVEHGADFDEAREKCAEVAGERGARYIHSGNEPLLIAGVGTATLELLERHHRRKAFSSGDRRVDEWLSRRALPAMRKNTSTTRVLADDRGAIAGFYTLANTALDVSLVPVDLFDGDLPRHPPPTLTLAWLGIDTRFNRRGLGTLLFARALADALHAYETVRFVAVIVDALTEKNVAFYESQGFRYVPGTANKLFLPAVTLVEIACQSEPDMNT